MFQDSKNEMPFCILSLVSLGDWLWATQCINWIVSSILAEVKELPDYQKISIYFQDKSFQSSG